MQTALLKSASVAKDALQSQVTMLSRDLEVSSSFLSIEIQEIVRVTTASVSMA